jgi:hypothetical protein
LTRRKPRKYSNICGRWANSPNWKRNASNEIHR